MRLLPWTYQILSDSERKKMMEAQNVFANSRVNITDNRKKTLGAVFWSLEYHKEYVKVLVKD